MRRSRELSLLTLHVCAAPQPYTTGCSRRRRPPRCAGRGGACRARYADPGHSMVIASRRNPSKGLPLISYPLSSIRPTGGGVHGSCGPIPRACLERSRRPPAPLGTHRGAEIDWLLETGDRTAGEALSQHTPVTLPPWLSQATASYATPNPMGQPSAPPPDFR